MTMKTMMAAALLLVSGGAAAQVPGDEERVLLDVCLSIEVALLDDGRSDARTIAGAMLNACADQRRKLYAAALGGRATPAEIARAMQQGRESALDRATVAVLRHRRKS